MTTRPSVAWAPGWNAISEYFVDIVTLQDGNRSTTTYCLPTATGSVHSYFEMAKAMGPGHLVYGVQFADRVQIGSFKKFSSLRDMASAIAPGLLTHHRGGSVCLVGYSFGAFLAIELAQQLTQLGVTVPLVAIIDKTPPSASFGGLFRLRHFMSSLLPYALRLATKTVADTKLWLAYRHTIVRGLLGRNNFEREMWYLSLPRNHQDYVANNFANLRTYRFNGTYRGKILLCRLHPSAELDLHPLRFNQLDDYGWRRITGANVDVAYIPGDHGTMMQSRNVQHIATALYQALNDVEVASATRSDHATRD